MADGYMLSEEAARQLQAMFAAFRAEIEPYILERVEHSGESRKRVIIGKTDAAHNKGSTGTISIYGGSAGGGPSLTDTGENISAYNRFGNIASGKWVAVKRFVHGWEIISAECT